MKKKNSISFTDSRGKCWYSNAWGKLKKMKKDSIVQRKIVLPVDSVMLEKID